MSISVFPQAIREALEHAAVRQWNESDERVVEVFLDDAVRAVLNVVDQKP